MTAIDSVELSEGTQLMVDALREALQGGDRTAVMDVATQEAAKDFTHGELALMWTFAVAHIGDLAAELAAARKLLGEADRLRLAHTTVTVALEESGRYGRWAQGEIDRLRGEIRQLRNPTQGGNVDLVAASGKWMYPADLTDVQRQQLRVTSMETDDGTVYFQRGVILAAHLRVFVPDSNTEAELHRFVEMPASSIGSCLRCSKPRSHTCHDERGVEGAQTPPRPVLSNHDPDGTPGR